jgi:hypothetical protein
VEWVAGEAAATQSFIALEISRNKNKMKKRRRNDNPDIDYGRKLILNVPEEKKTCKHFVSFHK